MLDELRRLALFTSGVAELTRNRAESVVRSLMDDHPEASAAVNKLLETSRQNRQELLRLITQELHDQVEALGLATRSDVERLERRVARLEERAREQAVAERPPTPKTTSKTTARTRRRRTAGQSRTPRTAASKTTAKSSRARKTTARKTTRTPPGEI